MTECPAAIGSKFIEITPPPYGISLLVLMLYFHLKDTLSSVSKVHSDTQTLLVAFLLWSVAPTVRKLINFVEVLV